MNAEAFRHFFEYHFTENRHLWDSYITKLSLEHFTRPVEYSHGSVRDQILHLISVDDVWFSDLRGAPLPEPLDPADFPDLATIRAYWDGVEQNMRAYLAALRDEMLATRPLSGEDENLLLWQILLHVVNHGTDHRAQLLRVLHDLGLKTVSQDYIFFTYDHPAGS
jgi:uncharacterized damage-inducible protein DinB